MKSGSGVSFGQHLVDKGLITSEQHEKALQIQNKARLLGEIAVELNYLKPDDVSLTAEYMEINPGVKFGEAAISIGLLNSNQLRYLLDVRTRRKVKIGDIIVENGFLDEETLRKEVISFNARRKRLNKILLCDPSHTITKVLERMLTKYGYEVYKAKSGAEAISVAAAAKPDILMTSIVLPDMEGYDLCNKLMFNSATMGVRMVMLSSDDTVENVEKAFENGINHFLKKPVSENELINIIYQIEREESEKRPEKILVVDDSHGARVVILKELASAGFRVFAAENGREGVEMAKALKPDIITMDVEMPVMDGFAACHALKDDPATEDVPVIIISAKSAPELREKGFAAGAVEYFSKPFKTGRLADYIRILFETRKINKSEKVLVVDDSNVTLHILKYIFRKNGYKVAAAKNAIQAAELLPEFMPDLIVTDCNMPGKDGFEFTRDIKSSQAYRHVPVIMVTASSSSEDILKGLAAGATDYIVKPFDEAELLARAGSHLDNKRLYDEVRKEKEALKKTNALKDRFIGMAAHDLRGPLSSISGFAALLEEDIPNRAEISSIIKNAADEMIGLIDDLLDISKIESGILDLKRMPYDIVDVVTRRVELFRSLAGRKSIALHIKPHPPIALWADKVKIQQVIDNILSNAIKYTKPGKNISVEITDAAESAQVAVRDEGVGIPKEELGRVFDGFAKLSSRPTSGEKSTGLGLAIASRIVKAHGGMLGVESEIGVGSVFSFSLPKGVPHIDFFSGK
ncbi:MAG: response regulator [Nitrospinae bacterium]|nr:response regulator [Nitrospinota bacterium]